MNQKTDKSCSLFKVAISLVGYALLGALTSGGRRRPRRTRRLKGVTQRAD